MKNALLVAEEALREPVLLALTAHGCTVLFASDAAEALAMVRRARFEVVVLQVADRGAAELCREMTSDPDGPFLLAIVEASAGVHPRTIIELGASDVLSWPPLPGDLDARLAVVARALEREEARARTEQALRESQERYAMIASATSDMVWDYDVTTGECIRTQAARFGHTPDQMAPTFGWWSEHIHPDDRAEVLATVRAAMEGTGATWAGEYRFRRGDGGYAHVLDRAFIQRDQDGTAVRVIGSMSDITEHREMEQRLLLSDRLAAVGTLAAGVAHEINNPLTYAMAHLDLAAKEAERIEHDVPSGAIASIEAHLRTARDGAERVRRIVRDLRTFSRGDDDKRAPIDVRQVLDFCLEMAQNEIRHRARLVKDYGDVPPVFANESRLAQVFLNLLVNAAQAIPEESVASNEISVTTRVEEGLVVVEIRDSGAGIPPELLSRIFDPFFTTKPVSIGTGLGLSICHSIIASLGGELTLSSAVGVGTTSRVSLPRATAEERARVQSPPSPIPEKPLRGGRILIVDDEPVLAGVMVEALEEHECVLVTSGKEALECCARGRFDLIFCDLMMPDMSGMEVYEIVRSTYPGLEERIVFVTGGAFTPKARAFLEVTKNPRIEKPFHIDALSDLARELIQKWVPE
jgi:PAS domain S-box-containing protein